MQLGKDMLGRRHCMPGVVAALHEVMVEGTFPDGTCCSPLFSGSTKADQRPFPCPHSAG
jgi:hypothetical protein